MPPSPPGADTTAPGAPNSILSRPPPALYVVYPSALAGGVVPLCDGLELGRVVRDALPAHRQAVLHHATVSRRHVGVHYGFEQWIVSDLGAPTGLESKGWS